MPESEFTALVDHSVYLSEAYTGAPNPAPDSTVSIVFTSVGGGWDLAELKFYSGVLLQIDDHYYLITAAHDILKWYKSRRTAYIIGIKAGVNGLLHLAFEQVYRSNEDSVDILVFRLQPAAASAIKESKKFLRISDLSALPDPSDGIPHYHVYGFPADTEYGAVVEDGELRAMRDFSFYATPYGIHGQTIDWQSRLHPQNNQGDRSAALFELGRDSASSYVADAFAAMEAIDGFDRSRHLLLDYPEVSERRDGEFTSPPIPKGMSGCGVWHLATSGADGTHRPGKNKLIGIQTAWHAKRRYLKVSQVRLALEGIWQHDAHARNPMRLYGIEF